MSYNLHVKAWRLWVQTKIAWWWNYPTGFWHAIHPDDKDKHRKD